MYLIKENNRNETTPVFIELPKTPENPYDPNLVFFPELKTAKWFFSSGIPEKILIMWVYEKLITPDKNFIDIGAHIGTYSLICGKKAKHTYSFECSPKTFCYLSANVALHQLEYKISPIPYGLGQSETTMEMYIRSEDGGGNGLKYLNDKDKKYNKVIINVKPLDSFNITDVSVIKIDVEGFELDVIKGALATLKNSSYPPIVFESWGEWKNNDGTDATQLRKELFEYLDSINYDIMPLRDVNDMFLAKYRL
jgi:FkbM family methyltransferase